MRFKISDVCNVNCSNLSVKENWKYINYLDTANLNEGVITQLQKLVIGQDVIPSRAKRKVKKNDILISTVRPNQKHYGILKNISENMVVSTGFTVLSVKEDMVDADYLYYFLTQERITSYFQAIAETSTSTYPSITSSVIEEIDIDLPLLSEQKAIARILSTLDEKIKLNNQINKTLENMTQTIFKHWFIDFEFPNEEGEPYKSSGGEMVECELGLIPKGWKVFKLGDYVNIKHGYAFKSNFFKEEETERILLTPGNFKIGGGFLNKKYKYYSLDGELKEEYILNKFDLIVTMTDLSRNGDTLGYPALVPEIEGKILLHNQRLGKIENKSGQLPMCFIYSLMCSNLYRHYILATATGTTVKHTAPSRIMEYRLPLPCNSFVILKKFDNVTGSFSHKIIDIISENLYLEKMRDILLPKLMSGEIRVPSGEKNEAS